MVVSLAEAPWLCICANVPDYDCGLSRTVANQKKIENKRRGVGCQQVGLPPPRSRRIGIPNFLGPPEIPVVLIGEEASEGTRSRAAITSGKPIQSFS